MKSLRSNAGVISFAVWAVIAVVTVLAGVGVHEYKVLFGPGKNKTLQTQQQQTQQDIDALKAHQVAEDAHRAVEEQASAAAAAARAARDTANHKGVVATIGALDGPPTQLRIDAARMFAQGVDAGMDPISAEARAEGYQQGKNASDAENAQLRAQAADYAKQLGDERTARKADQATAEAKVAAEHAGALQEHAAALSATAAVAAGHDREISLANVGASTWAKLKAALILIAILVTAFYLLPKLAEMFPVLAPLALWFSKFCAGAHARLHAAVADAEKAAHAVTQKALALEQAEHAKTTAVNQTLATIVAAAPAPAMPLPKSP